MAIFNNLQELNQVLVKEGRVLALDVGTKTIGVAISDLSRTISNPKTTIRRKSNVKDLTYLRKFITENDIKAVIIGLPLNMDNSESQMSEFVRRFARAMEEALGNIPIAFCDERLTSFEAQEIINASGKKAEEIHQISASVILQAALEEMKKDKI